MNASIAGGLSARLGPRTGLTASIISSGNPVRNGLLRYLVADSIPGSVGSSVPSFPDSSGNGNVVTQAVMAAQPLLATGQNGKRAISFDGVSSSMAGAGLFTGSDARSMFVAYQQNGSGPFTYAVAGQAGITGTGNWFLLQARSPDGISIFDPYFSGFGADIAVVGSGGNAWEVVCVVYDGTTATLYKNGSTVGAAALSLNTAASSFTLGTDLLNEMLNGKIGMVCEYNRAVTTPEIASIFSFMKGYYAIP